MRRLIQSLFSGFTVFAVAIVLVMGSANSASTAETTTPAQFLDEFGAQVIKVLSETAPGEARRDSELRRLLGEGFDIDYIGRFVLGRYWRTASEAERAEFRRLFEDYLIAAYGRRFGTYSGEKFVVGQTFPQDDERVLVRTEVVRVGGDSMIVDWRLQQHDGLWRIVDVMVEGVSMMVTQRSEFTALIQREGGSVSALNVRLRTLTTNLNEQPRKS